ncbi:hypothetical protein [Actinomadura flavalba]|uniref:hypothetical protein n=1 Tax=Actinomadura flavalba TaxID=1120938 RepID=UPI0003815D93|nr:hypothetical protein [Actinomadura flavalba]
MEAPSSTGRRRTSVRRAALALTALAAGALPLTAGAAVAPAQAAPGDTKRMEQLNRQIAKLDKEYGGDLAKLRDAEYGVKKSLRRSAELKKDLGSAQHLVAQMAASTYMTRGQDPAVQVLADRDPSSVLSSASLATHVTQNQAARVQQISRLVAEQEKARKEAEQKIKDLEKDIADLNRERSRIRVLVKKYKPESPSVGMGGVTPRMNKVHKVIDLEFGPFPTIGCVRMTGDPQDHASGRACDFMVSIGTSPSSARQRQGDQVAAYAVANANRLGIKYVIWRQRIYDMRSPGWRSMENRGGITANHYDHVHISVF